MHHGPPLKGSRIQNAGVVYGHEEHRKHKHPQKEFSLKMKPTRKKNPKETPKSLLFALFGGSFWSRLCRPKDGPLPSPMARVSAKKPAE